MKPRKKQYSIYEKQYDTVEEAKMSPFQRSIANAITLHMPNKKVRMQDPQFASTDAQRFVGEYEKRRFRNKQYKDFKRQNLRYLPLRKINDPYYKDNAYYDSEKKEFGYNGVPSKDNKYFPTFADVMAHEAGHYLDDIYSKVSYLYPPLTKNNGAILRLKDLSKRENNQKYSNVADLIQLQDRRLYDSYHDEFPNEMFADIIADKYRMNVENIYNSLGNIPFSNQHLKAYRNFLKSTTGFPWTRGMYNLYDYNKSKYLPDDDVYINVMNDL